MPHAYLRRSFVRKVHVHRKVSEGVVSKAWQHRYATVWSSCLSGAMGIKRPLLTISPYVHEILEVYHPSAYGAGGTAELDRRHLNVTGAYSGPISLPAGPLGVHSMFVSSNDGPCIQARLRITFACGIVRHASHTTAPPGSYGQGTVYGRNGVWVSHAHGAQFSLAFKEHRRSA
jgi:hypothetical protein